MKTIDQIKSDIETKTGSTLTLEGNVLVVPKEKIQEVVKFLKSNSEYEMDYLSCLAGTDYKEHIEVTYHLYSTSKKDGQLALKVKTDRTESKVPSVTPIWRGAEFQEREAYDLLGVKFEGHPDLRRILMWEGFEHYPLRKDYVQDDQDRKPENFFRQRTD